MSSPKFTDAEIEEIAREANRAAGEEAKRRKEHWMDWENWETDKGRQHENHPFNLAKHLLNGNKTDKDELRDWEDEGLLPLGEVFVDTVRKTAAKIRAGAKSPSSKAGRRIPSREMLEYAGFSNDEKEAERQWRGILPDDDK